MGTKNLVGKIVNYYPEAGMLRFSPRPAIILYVFRDKKKREQYTVSINVFLLNGKMKFIEEVKRTRKRKPGRWQLS